MSHPTTFDCGSIKPKGILKNSSDPPLTTSEPPTNDILNKSAKVHWDEKRLLEDEVERSGKVKDARMEEEKKLLTPFIRYDPSTEIDDQMETFRLSPGISSRSSSTASSPKRVQVVAMDDWPDSDEDMDSKQINAEHESFRKLRDRHYGGEGNILRRDANSIDSSSSDEDMDLRDGSDQQFRGVRIPPPLPAMPGSVATIPQPMLATSNGVSIPNGALPHRKTPGVTQRFKETYGVEDASMSDKKL
ncbi:hypothetical protein COEREDRAFT_82388 [Coemansia reversa NRRL 1564]|uniref:Protein phosphatase inhibitor 2 n=1 Tax=Coemansia reversa (strain ATCC 12441 / NRRL 1564) TaxID=763665 RepID=A0A2G5B7J8_COERN|nr:hypothetical protein COEREDRAFT_82388 [Coemansia reversa NRRL 1564]|eukprot:PIA14970.1 hypothetical protein COEREDRAFT_82388 [Coemansia reversa NRRL 1564]